MSAGAAQTGPRSGPWRGLSRNVLALSLVSLLTDVSSEMLVYLIPLFLANVLAASPAIIGLIEGVAESCASLLKLASGAISDRMRRRRLLVGLGYGASVISKALYLVAYTWPVVLVARVGDRVGKGIRTAPRDALLADSTASDTRGRAFGFHRAMDTLGAFIGVATAALVIALLHPGEQQLDEGTFQLLVLLALIPGVLALVTIVLGVQEIRPRAGPRPARVGPTLRARLGAELRRFPRVFWLFVLASAVFTLGNSSDAFLALRTQALGATILELLLMIVAFNLANAVTAFPIGALSDRVGRRGLIALAWSIYALAYAGFALAGGPLAAAGLWVLYGVYYGVSDAVGRALVADLAPSDVRATGYGIVNAVVGLMILPASIIAGLLWDRIAPAAPFWFGATCATLAVVLLLVLVRPPEAIEA
ncbi:MAG: MFS transporter [Candidatus Limnocylindrales bacterium]